MRSLFLSLWLVSAAAWSSTDLLVAWQAARQHDPAYLGEKALALTSTQKTRQADALWLPYVGLQASAGYVDMKNEVQDAQFSAPAMGSMDHANFTTDIRDGQDTRWGIMAVQPLYNAERSANAAQLAQQAKLIALQFDARDQQLFVQVAERYFAVLAAEDALDVLRAQKKAVQESLDIAREKFKIGQSASTDMHEAQAEFDAVVAQEFALQSQLELKRTLFTDLTGMPADGLSRVRTGSSLERLRPQSLHDLIEEGLARNPQVAMGEVGQSVANLEIDKYRATNATTVDLVAQYGQQRIHGGGASSSTDNRTGWIGVQVNIPLFTGGMRNAKYEEAIALADKARQDAQSARLMISQRIRTAYLGLTTALAQIKALEQGVKSAQSKLDATLTGHEVGARTTADVLNAQQAFFHTQNLLTQTRYQVLLSALSLSEAGGTLDETRLQAVNAYLQQ